MEFVQIGLAIIAANLLYTTIPNPKSLAVSANFDFAKRFAFQIHGRDIDDPEYGLRKLLFA
jgi:hypothetical protein